MAQYAAKENSPIYYEKHNQPAQHVEDQSKEVKESTLKLEYVNKEMSGTFVECWNWWFGNQMKLHTLHLNRTKRLVKKFSNYLIFCERKSPTNEPINIRLQI